MNKSDLHKYNLSTKELNILLINLNTGNDFFVKRVLDRMDSGLSFYDAFYNQYHLDVKLDIQNAIYKRECAYWDQMNEIYQYS